MAKETLEGVEMMVRNLYLYLHTAKRSGRIAMLCFGEINSFSIHINFVLH